jgi:hypothetical protein
MLWAIAFAKLAAHDIPFALMRDELASEDEVVATVSTFQNKPLCGSPLTLTVDVISTFQTSTTHLPST